MNKLSKFCNELSNHTDIKPEIYLSPATGYRARAEFGFSKHSYTMVENKQKIYMDKSSIPHPFIEQLMPNLLSKINDSEILQKKLFQIRNEYYSGNKEGFFCLTKYPSFLIRSGKFNSFIINPDFCSNQSATKCL